MSERTWTEAQNAAINTKGSSLLVSAAAGSGKTATLTERIIRSLTEGDGDISRMLVVTFTRAAASELRDRVRRALEEASVRDSSLRRQLLRLDGAKICTIHSFCLDVLRPSFAAVGLPAKFRTLDEAEVKILRRRVMDELITDCYDSAWSEIYGGEIDFSEFADCFLVGRGEDSLIDLFLEIYETLSSCGRDGGVSLWDSSADSLEKVSADNFLSDTPYGRVIRERTEEFCSHYERVFSHISRQIDRSGKQAAYLPAICSDIDFISRLSTAADKGYTALRTVAEDYAPKRLGALKAEFKTDYTEAYKSLREDFKDEIKKLRTAFFAFPPDVLEADCRRTGQICRAGGKFLAEFDRRYSAAKRRMAAIDYGDMERMTLSLLEDEGGGPTQLAREISERYDMIFIDEYQDVNSVQDRIFSAVSRPDNRFMVGDIKQSIYGFRGAMPEIFADYRRRFSDRDGGQVIFMSENFRSDPSVISFTNAVFDPLWSVAGGSIDYRAEDRLKCGKSDCGDVPVRIFLTETGSTGRQDEEGDDDAGIAVDEAQRVAQEIRRLIETEKKNDGSPIKPGDIAVILRSAGERARRYEEALKLEGIPCEGCGDDRFFENPEILMVLCLLCAIDNPRRDVYLLGLMLSPLCGFTLEETVKFRRAGNKETAIFDSLRQYCSENEYKKGEKFLSELSKYREMARGVPCDRFIWRLYRECGILTVARDERARENLLALHDCARSYESHGFKGLYSFVRYLLGLLETGAVMPTQQSRSSAGASDNAVKIMTVHGSKGLEFPVCFVCDCGKRQNDRDTTRNLLFDRKCGFAMKLKIIGHSSRAETALRGAVASAMIRRNREEELRVLYVAMTRARERLYVTASVRDAEKLRETSRLRGEYLDAYSVASQNTYIDLIMSAMAAATCPDCIIEASEAAARDDRKKAPDEATSDKSSLPVPSSSEGAYFEEQKKELSDILGKRFEFEYPYGDISRLPAKLSVSRLYPGVLDEEEGADVGYADERAAYTLASGPAFLSEKKNGSASGADAGTATHVFLQFCDFDAISDGSRDSISAELDRTVRSGFLTEGMAAAVRTGEILAFVRSPLFSEMRHALRIYREHRFNLLLPASDFTLDARRSEALSRETVLVQGVMDCFFETAEGELVLVDYKTDRVPQDNAEAAASILRERHRQQLSYYSKALSQIFGKSPDRVLIFSLALGRTVEM